MSVARELFQTRLMNRWRDVSTFIARCTEKKVSSHVTNGVNRTTQTFVFEDGSLITVTVTVSELTRQTL